MDNNDVATAVERLKLDFQRRYKMSREDVEWTYRTALDYYISRAFPLRHDIVDMPASRIGDLSFIRSFMTDIIEREGVSSITAYSENGMSYSFDGSMFDSKIASLIVPQCKVISL